MTTTEPLRLEIPVITPTLNVRQRMHHRAIGRLQNRFAMELRVALGARRPAALERARVSIERHSRGAAPDHDNLLGGAKDLIDALLTPRITDRSNPFAIKGLHLFGVGLLVDDAPDRLALTIRPVRISPKAQPFTVITIEAMA